MFGGAEQTKGPTIGPEATGGTGADDPFLLISSGQFGDGVGGSSGSLSGGSSGVSSGVSSRESSGASSGASSKGAVADIVGNGNIVSETGLANVAVSNVATKANDAQINVVSANIVPDNVVPENVAAGEAFPPPKIKSLNMFGKKVSMEEEKVWRLLYGTSAFLVALNGFMLPFAMPKMKRFLGAPYLPSNKNAVSLMFERVLPFQTSFSTETIPLGNFVPDPTKPIRTLNPFRRKENRNNESTLNSAQSSAQSQPSAQGQPVPGGSRTENVAATPPWNGRRLLDFGSGDGRIVLTAAKHGYEAVGYEINPYLYLLSKWKSVRYLNREERKRVRFYLSNIWKAKKPFHNVDVVTVYGRPGDKLMEKIATKLEQEGKPNVLVVSNVFALPGWERKLVKEVDGIRLYDNSLGR